MKVLKYRLTSLGKLGAALFVAPTPIFGFYLMPPTQTAAQAAFTERLRAMGSAVETSTPSPTVLTLLATSTMIGLVLLLIGREVLTEE